MILTVDRTNRCSTPGLATLVEGRSAAATAAPAEAPYVAPSCVSAEAAEISALAADITALAAEISARAAPVSDDFVARAAFPGAGHLGKVLLGRNLVAFEETGTLVFKISPCKNGYCDRVNPRVSLRVDPEVSITWFNPEIQVSIPRPRGQSYGHPWTRLWSILISYCLKSGKYYDPSAIPRVNPLVYPRVNTMILGSS